LKEAEGGPLGRRGSGASGECRRRAAEGGGEARGEEAGRGEKRTKEKKRKMKNEKKSVSDKREEKEQKLRKRNGSILTSPRPSSSTQLNSLCLLAPMELASPSSSEELDAAGRVRLAVEQVRIWKSSFSFSLDALSEWRRQGGIFSLSERTQTHFIWPHSLQFNPHRLRPTSTCTRGCLNLLEACLGGCEKRRQQQPRRQRLQLFSRLCRLRLRLRPASSAPPGRVAAGRQEELSARMIILLRRGRP